MKLSETFESIRVCDDDKARRVLNVSQSRATITADEIESGVTIERLASIGVPVFRYSTQVTIHGVIPDFNPESRPMGYKAIFRNQNGSLGVKYVAVDGAKKALIVQAARLAKGRQFSASVNSTGLELVFATGDKESAIAAFRAFPKELIIGGLYAARGVYGDFFVIADVGAVESRNLWPLIGRLYGFNSQAELDAAQAAQDTEYAIAREKYHRECDERAAQREAQNELALSQTLSQIALPQLDRLPTGEGAFVRVNDDGEAWLYVLRKRGAQLCYTSVRYVEGMTASAVNFGNKMKRFAERRPYIEKSLALGRVFAV